MNAGELLPDLGNIFDAKQAKGIEGQGFEEADQEEWICGVKRRAFGE